MNNVSEFAIVNVAHQPGVIRRRIPRPRAVRSHDDRWPAVAAALVGLRSARRSSIRIVDAECGSGALLLCAVRHARALGFTAIEARGIDNAAALVERARVAAGALNDPAIGITFETAEPADALGDESDFPADIVLWHGCQSCNAASTDAVAHAGLTLIADPVRGAGTAQ